MQVTMVFGIKEEIMKTEFKVVNELPELEEMQKFVGGYVERLPLPNGDAMYVNEEGRLLDLPVNKMASVFWYINWKQKENIVGNVIYCQEKDE